jgi:hypothetical protein
MAANSHQWTNAAGSKRAGPGSWLILGAALLLGLGIAMPTLSASAGVPSANEVSGPSGNDAPLVKPLWPDQALLDGGRGGTRPKIGSKDEIVIADNDNKKNNNKNWKKQGNNNGNNNGPSNGNKNAQKNWNNNGNGNWNKGNKNWNKNANKNWNNGNKNWNKHVYVRNWSKQPYYGQFIGGIVLGTIIGATGVGIVPLAPEPDLCWYWTDPSMTRGYWDYCQ